MKKKRKKKKEGKSFVEKKFFDLWVKYESARRNPQYINDSRIYFMLRAIIKDDNGALKRESATLGQKYPHLFPINPFSWDDNKHILLGYKKDALPNYDIPIGLSVLGEDYKNTGILKGIQINLKYPLIVIMELLKKTIDEYQKQYFKKHPEYRNKKSYSINYEKALRNFKIYDKVMELEKNSKWKNRNEEFSEAIKKEERDYKSYHRWPKLNIVAKEFNISKQTAWDSRSWAHKRIFGSLYKKDKSILSAKANTYSLNERISDKDGDEDEKQNAVSAPTTNRFFLDIPEETYERIMIEIDRMKKRGISSDEIINTLKENHKEYKEVLEELFTSFPKL